MQALNDSLFLLINAPAHPSALMLFIAKLFAEHMIWLVPIGLMVGWLRSGERTRKLLLEASTAGLAGLLINQLIGLVWQHPRPFMIGLGHTFLSHAPDSSFPSDHLTLLWCVAFSLLLNQRSRVAGALLAILGLPMAWARIYLGVHFPLDMVGAALVAGLSASLCFRQQRWFMATIYRAAISLYHPLFAIPIRWGWVRY